MLCVLYVVCMLCVCCVYVVCTLCCVCCVYVVYVVCTLCCVCCVYSMLCMLCVLYVVCMLCVLYVVCIVGEIFNVKAKCVVNATGPFTDFVRQMDSPEIRKICQPSSGVHIVLPDYYRYIRYYIYSFVFM